MPSLSALSVEHLDAVEYARKVYLDAGGDLSDVLERLSLPFLLRFLIGNNWDLKKTAAMLKSTAEWRKKKGADEARRRMANGLKPAQFPHAVGMMTTLSSLISHLPSHDGDLISYTFVDGWEPSRFLKAVSFDEFLLFNMHALEMQNYLADVRSLEQDKFYRTLVVWDAEGAGMQHLNPSLLSRLKAIAPLPDLYYPEMVSAIRVLNSPWVAARAYDIIKHLLSAELKSRISLTDKAKSQAMMDSLAAPQSIPAGMFGGAAQGHRERAPAGFFVEYGFDSFAAQDFGRIFPGRKLAGYVVAESVALAASTSDTASSVAAAVVAPASGSQLGELEA